MEAYFNDIRQDKERLYNFLQRMPKGADIHHHALGALWAEAVLAVALEKGLWVAPDSGQLLAPHTDGALPIASLLEQEDNIQHLIDCWSVRNFDRQKGLAHHHFFDIFPKIAPVFVGNEAFWLQKIAAQAKAEGLLYVETLIDCPEASAQVAASAASYPRSFQASATTADFEQLEQHLRAAGLENALLLLLGEVDSWLAALQPEQHARLGLQLYAVRTLDPRQVFAQLLLSFEAAARSPHILGVNLVAPEHHANTLAYYSLQMRCCAWLRRRYPQVQLALHAGELTANLVAPEHLRFHIDEALRLAGAKRIGHGVDILSEDQREDLFAYMQQQGIALEVLLESNDFILGVKGAEHPITAYLERGVPLVLATDDPGLLRCTLSDQFFLAATQYPNLRYAQLKEFAFNSLKYSFLPTSEQETLLTQLSAQFLDFEKAIGA